MGKLLLLSAVFDKLVSNCTTFNVHCTLVSCDPQAVIIPYIPLGLGSQLPSAPIGRDFKQHSEFSSLSYSSKLFYRIGALKFDKTTKNGRKPSSIYPYIYFIYINQGQRCSVAEVGCSGVPAETTSRGALVVGGQRGHKLPWLPGPVHLVAAQTSLQVSFLQMHVIRNVFLKHHFM